MKICKNIITLGLLLLFAYTPQSLAQEDELLPPEEAFSLSAWIEGDNLVAEYRIAPGYYMYRERFDFQIEAGDAPARFDVAQIPDGKIKNDEFFGEMETYRNRVRIQLPILFESARANRLEIRATSQGCADIGVCYPPLKQSLAMDLTSTAKVLPTAWIARDTGTATPSAEVTALQSLLAEVTSNLDNKQNQSNASGAGDSNNALAALQALGENLGLDGDDEILHPDQAFILTARLDANNIVRTNILMADNIYLYRDKIKIAKVSGDGHSLGAISVPRGKKKDDEFFGPMEVIYGQVDLAIPLISEANASDRIVLSYGYQGCVEDRICYPPITKYLSIDASAGLIQVVDQVEAPSDRPVTASAGTAELEQAPISEQDQFTAFLKDKIKACSSSSDCFSSPASA